MVKVAFSHRILCDKYFISWVLSQPEEERKEILRKMMFVKSSSQHHSRSHNLILNDEFNSEDLKNIISEKLPNISNILGAVKPVSCPEFLNGEKDMLSKNVKYAVFLTNNKPYKTFILTDAKTETEYLKNSHYTPLKSTVLIKSEKNAVFIIDSFYREFIAQRNFSK